MGDRPILFYTSIPHSFRTTLIGYLYEIVQVYPVVLLAEELSPDVKKILEDKSLFPNLNKIIPVNQYTGLEESRIKKYRRLRALAKKVINDYHPWLVVTANDLYSFEMHLFRYAKRGNAITVCIQPGGTIESRVVKLWIDLTNAYLKFPSFIPLHLRLFLARIRKYFGYFLYHWLLPILGGETPFPGKASYILETTTTGMREADYQIVFSTHDYDIHRKGGVPKEKLIIIDHPVTRDTKKIFNILLQRSIKPNEKRKNIATLMLPSEISIGFRRQNLSLISREQYEKRWIEIVKLVSESLPGWEIYVKPHPTSGNIDILQEELMKISKKITVVSPGESAERYIEIANIVIGLPPSASTTLFVASIQNPSLPIISLDTEQELIGDFYKDSPRIDYVSSNKELLDKLSQINNNTYRKRQNKLTSGDFRNLVEFIEYAIQKR